MIGDAYDHVVVMFSDIVGFSTMSSTMSAVEVFLMLTNLYYAFDRLVDKFGVYKVETIGDGYMIAAGTPRPDTAVLPWHILELCIHAAGLVRVSVLQKQHQRSLLVASISAV